MSRKNTHPTPGKSVAECQPDTAAVFYQDPSCTVIHGDYRDHLPTLRLSGAAMVFADPPYHVGIKYRSYADKVVSRNQYAKDLVWALRSIAPLVILTPGTTNLYTYPEPDGLLCRVDKTAQSPGRFAYMCKWEPVLVYGKPRRKLAWDVIETASQSERAREPLDHPVPKPISLLHTIIERWTRPGDLVVDPFLGSGTTLRAAKNLGRRGLGVEIDEGYCAQCASRLSQEVLAPVQTSLLGDAAATAATLPTS